MDTFPLYETDIAATLTANDGPDRTLIATNKKWKNRK